MESCSECWAEPILAGPKIDLKVLGCCGLQNVFFFFSSFFARPGPIILVKAGVVWPSEQWSISPLIHLQNSGGCPKENVKMKEERS